MRVQSAASALPSEAIGSWSAAACAVCRNIPKKTKPARSAPMAAALTTLSRIWPRSVPPYL